MRKITVTLDDPVYNRLIDYVAAKSKRDKGRLNLSESASELIALALSGHGQESEVR
jgi:hypothetical protein